MSIGSLFILSRSIQWGICFVVFARFHDLTLDRHGHKKDVEINKGTLCAHISEGLSDKLNKAIKKFVCLVNE